MPLPYVVYRCPKSPEVFDALRDSFKAVERPASSFLDRRRTAIVGGLEYGSDTLLREIRTTGHPHLFVDSGYLKSKRGGTRELYRVVPNAFHHHWVNTARADKGARFAELGMPLKAWRRTGRDILVCPSNAKHHWFFGLERWVDETVTVLRKSTDRPIVVRTHEAAQAGTVPPLAVALESAWAVVSHTSTSAVEAAISGVPVFCAPENPAAPVAMSLEDLHLIEQPANFAREAWANALAWGQFTVSEIQSGLARACAIEAEGCRPSLPDGEPGWRNSKVCQSKLGLD